MQRPPPGTARPTTSRPVTEPPLKAASSAGGTPPRAASATREFERTETVMPIEQAAADGRVRAHAAVHADVAAGAREDAADHEADAGRDALEDHEDDREDDRDQPEDHVLAVQGGLRALADTSRHLLHPLVAGREAQQPLGHERAVEDPGGRADERDDDAVVGQEVSQVRISSIDLDSKRSRPWYVGRPRKAGAAYP